MATKIDVADTIERQSKNRFQRLLMLWISITMIVEGFDNQVQGYTAPNIIKLWHISKASFSPVFVCFQVGFMIGVVGLGNIGDIIGRRVMIILGVSLFGVFTIAGAYTSDITGLAITRLLAAVFLGGAIPNAIALAVEYAPLRHRAVRVGIMYVCYSLGAAAGGFLAAWMVPRFGWTSIYQLGGWSALGLVVVLFFMLPESARFLVMRTQDRHKLVAILRKLAPDVSLPADAAFVATTEKRASASALELFRDDRRIKTITLWIASFGSMVALQFITSWMPTIFADSRLGYSWAVIAVGLFQTGGALGGFAAGWILDRNRGILWLSIIALIGAPVVIAFSSAIGITFLLMVLVSTAGFCIVGSQIGLNALSGVVYPTAIRSTGSGWVYGIGRIGAIVGPILGGVLISLHLDISKIFLIVAIPPLCVCVALFILHLVNPDAVTKTA
jgi:MFS transporter, AAHS family, 4-hydroxybenzoate transporter